MNKEVHEVMISRSGGDKYADRSLSSHTLRGVEGRDDLGWIVADALKAVHTSNRDVARIVISVFCQRFEYDMNPKINDLVKKMYSAAKELLELARDDDEEHAKRCNNYLPPSDGTI